MVDPSTAMESLQKALKQSLSLERCVIATNLRMIKDQHGNAHRFSYALIEDKILQAYCAFVTTDPIDGILCFNIGYAVPERFRNQGLATKTLEDSIRELSAGLKRANIPQFYIEAIVGKDNVASQKVAERVLTASPKEVVDQTSGEPAFAYHRLIG